MAEQNEYRSAPRELCPHCREPMQLYIMAPHVLRSGRTNSYCPSCALVTCKITEETSAESSLASS
jgi:hypothetical protein